MQNHAADQLHVKMAHAHDPLAGFTHDSKGLTQQVIKHLAVGKSLPEFVRLGTKFIVTQRSHALFKRADRFHLRAHALDQSGVSAAKQLLQNLRYHFV